MINEINNFINHFHKISPTNDVSEVFTKGCCYWFAYILCSRFPDAQMMYDPIDCHFVAKINDRLYDITGDVTDKYKAVVWESITDELERQRIIDYCIEFNK